MPTPKTTSWVAVLIFLVAGCSDPAEPPSIDRGTGESIEQQEGTLNGLAVR
jgi:hypothetical protein